MIGPYVFPFHASPPQAGEVGIRLYLVDYLQYHSVSKRGMVKNGNEFFSRIKDIGLMYLPKKFRVVLVYTERIWQRPSECVLCSYEMII
jgi:hypothetical protein